MPLWQMSLDVCSLSTLIWAEYIWYKNSLYGHGRNWFSDIFTDVDECSDASLGNESLCFNNGSCVNNLGSYTCNCLAEWTGSRCEIGNDIIKQCLIQIDEFIIF